MDMELQKWSRFAFRFGRWELWKERNARWFHEATTQVPHLLAVIKHQVEQWVQACAKGLGCLLQQAVGAHVMSGRV